MPDPTTGPIRTRQRLRRAVRKRTSPAPGSVWLTGQRDHDTQLDDGGYVDATRLDADHIPAAVAAHAIALYTAPGAVVVDPDCGAGTTLVEALRMGRHAVGITSDRRAWDTARANLTTIKRAGAVTDGMVLDDTATLTPDPWPDPRPARPADWPNHLAGLAGRADLVLTTAARLAQRRGPDCDPVSDLAAVLSRTQKLLRADGHAVLVVPHVRRDGELLDRAGDIVTLTRAAGLIPVDRCVALLAELRGQRVITRASLAQRRAVARHHQATGRPIGLIAHHDVLVFQRADTADDRAVVLAATDPLPGIAPRELMAA